MKLQNNMSAISGGMTNGAITTAAVTALMAFATTGAGFPGRNSTLVAAAAAATCSYFHDSMVSGDVMAIENGTIAGIAGMDLACAAGAASMEFGSAAAAWSQATATAGYNWTCAKYAELRG